MAICSGLRLNLRRTGGRIAFCKLEALLIVMDKTGMLLISGGGEIIEPDDDIIAIGSGGNFALSAARALKRHAGQMEAISRVSLYRWLQSYVYTRIVI